MRFLYIESNPKIMGGAWVIKGTRVPMERIVAQKDRGRTIEDIIGNDYPHLTKVKISLALLEYILLKKSEKDDKVG